jgi:hypothetical protein
VIEPSKALELEILARDLGHGQLTPFEREDQILGVQFELFESHFLELLVFGEVGLLKQFFQTLCVAVMFGVQTTDFVAPHGTLYLVHQAPPVATQFSLSAEIANFPRTTYVYRCDGGFGKRQK